MSELTAKTLTEIRDLLAKGEVKATEAVTACLARIEKTEPTLKAMLSVQAEEALARAAALDAAGPDADKPLWGVPLSIKDVLTTEGVPTTCGSKMLENFTPFFDATAVARLKDAGAILLGKANMDEFAMGSSTENSAFQVTTNPWDETRVPGGSSGGSAAGVAARQAFGSIGTDTGGSIRQPAAFCGCVGLKPTYGRVSRYGLVAFGSSLDQAGPLARSVDDVAALLQVIAGPDEKDSTCSDTPVPDYAAALANAKDLKGLTIGLPTEYWAQGLDDETETALKTAIARAEELGAKTVPVAMPHTKYAVATYYIICMAEASSNLARFDGVRYGFRAQDVDELVDMYVASRSQAFGDEVQRRIMIGTYVLSSGYYDAYFRKAAQVRRLFRQDFTDALAQCDVIAAPVSPTAAWQVGALTDDPLQMYLMDIYTVSLNLAGLPGLSLPVGLGQESGMPIGLQLIGKPFDETGVLATAKALEGALDPLPDPIKA